MSEKFLNTFSTKSHRLAGYDYGSNGAYFVTIKTHKMQNYFGEIVQTSHGTSQHSALLSIKKEELERSNKTFPPNAETRLGASGRLSKIGMIAKENWEAIPQHFPFVRLDVFEIMPNHIHGILILKKNERKKSSSNDISSQTGTLGTIVNLYKGSITTYAKNNNIEFKWHPRYHDIIIRNEEALNNIRNYIQNNPAKWLEKYSG
jgi:putative transposase